METFTLAIARLKALIDDSITVRKIKYISIPRFWELPAVTEPMRMFTPIKTDLCRNIR